MHRFLEVTSPGLLRRSAPVARSVAPSAQLAPFIALHAYAEWHVRLLLLQFKKGDRVIGLAPWYWMSFKEGTYAEYVSAKEEWLATAPNSVPLHEAGQIPLVALTAWQVHAGKLLPSVSSFHDACIIR